MIAYLDHHATTPLEPEALDAMLPFLTGTFGNAASRGHAFGAEASRAVEGARETVAAYLGAQPREIVFTSGATESNNLAIKGVTNALAGLLGPTQKAKHLISQKTEHKAVLETLVRLERRGFEVTLVDVDEHGLVDPASIESALRDDTFLVSVMWCNNEVGTYQDLDAIGAITRKAGVLLHCDASQGNVYRRPNLSALPVDLMSITGHKMYGPKGVGALFVRRRDPRVPLVAEFDGGGHEHARRSGTLNVPGIVGFAKAAEVGMHDGEAGAVRVAELRNMLLQMLREELGTQVLLNGPEPCDPKLVRHPGNLNVSFDGVDGASLLLRLAPEFALSSGSACSSGTAAPSYVLTAMGMDKARAANAIRFGLGRRSSEDDVRRAATRTIELVRELRVDPRSVPAGW